MVPRTHVDLDGTCRRFVPASAAAGTTVVHVDLPVRVVSAKKIDLRKWRGALPAGGPAKFAVISHHFERSQPV